MYEVGKKKEHAAPRGGFIPRGPDYNRPFMGSKAVIGGLEGGLDHLSATKYASSLPSPGRQLPGVILCRDGAVQAKGSVEGEVGR